MRMIRYIPVLLALIVASKSHAQNSDTAIKSNTIEIVQSYQPEVKQNPKPVMHPAIPPIDTTHPSFNYEVPQQTLYYTYNSTPLRPLALGKDTTYNNYTDFLKLGLGNLSSILAEYGGSGKGKNLFSHNSESAIHLRSFSQKGGIDNQKSWLLDGDVNSKMYGETLQWNVDIGFARNQQYLYGYDHALYQFDGSQVKQTFSSGTLGVNVLNYKEGNIHYNPGISYTGYTGENGAISGAAKESTLGITLPVTYTVDTSILLKAALNATITKFEDPSQSFSNNIIQLKPGIEYHKGNISGHAYLSPTAGKDNTYFLPDLLGNYQLAESHIVINAGVQGLITQNSYAQLSTLNPFLYTNNFTSKQNHSTEVFGGVVGTIGHHITLSGRLSWWSYDNLPVFINNIGDMKQFIVVYDNNLNAISLNLAAKYQVSNSFIAQLSTTTYSYSNGSLVKVWNMPTSKVKGEVTYHPTKELFITGYVYVLNGINALDNMGNTKQLDGIFDIGGNVEYSITPWLSLFAQGTNLLNNKNERWLGYSSYGLNILGGARVKF